MTIMKTRRELLLEALATAGLLGAAGVLGAERVFAAGEAAPARAGKAGRRPRGFRIGACDWTIGKMADPAALELARTLGLDGLQVDIGRENNFPVLKPEVQAQYQEKIKATGMRVSTLAMGVLNSNPYFSEPRAQEWLSGAIDACKPLGARGILLAFFGKGDLRPDPKNIETVTAKLKEIAPKAEQARVRLLIESQLPAETLMKIIESVGSRAVGAYYDVGNCQRCGYDIVKEIKLLGKHIGEFHAKDNNLYGKGQINFPAVRQAMDEIGYRGWIHIEGDKFPNGMLKDCPVDAAYLRTVFPKQV
jgi:sugar phosphate isomerase/epimerase